MLELPKTEQVLLIHIALFSLAAAFVGLIQLYPRGNKYKFLMPHLLVLVMIFESGILVLRAIAINAFPLTGLFESMIVLCLILGIICLILLFFIRQVWLGSLMSWVLLGLVLIVIFIAKSSSKPHPIASEPWVITHGLTMVFGAASILLAAVLAIVSLTAIRRLKLKQFDKVAGNFPNIEKLGHLNFSALKWAFIFFSVGMVTGIVGAFAKANYLGNNTLSWLFDSKILGVTIAWALLALIMILRRIGHIKGRRVAQVTIIIMIWILFAFVGSHVLCKSKHDFSSSVPQDRIPPRETQE